MLVSKGKAIVEIRFCVEKQRVNVLLGKRMLVNRQREGDVEKKEDLR